MRLVGDYPHGFVKQSHFEYLLIFNSFGNVFYHRIIPLTGEDYSFASGLLSQAIIFIYYHKKHNGKVGSCQQLHFKNYVFIVQSRKNFNSSWKMIKFMNYCQIPPNVKKIMTPS